MKRILPPIVLAFLLVALFCYLANYGARANCLNPLWIGSVGGGTISVSGGPPNTTVYYDFTESNPGLVVYATQQFGTYSNSLHLPVVLNGAGSGSAPFYFKPIQVGQTTERINSPQLGDWIYSGCTYNVLQPASTVSVIQYLKNGVYVDVPNPLTVVKGDTVQFKAIPSPAGSVFTYYSNGPIDPTWSGSSGATGVSETTPPLLFDTASSNNHDYKTVIASVQNGGSYTANVLVVNGVQSVTIDKIDPATEFNDNPNTGGGKRVFPDKNDPSDTVDRKRVRVTALTSLPSKKTIYFKSFDLDDPSANAAPIDTNGSVGDDNRGGVGTPAHAGLLSPVGGTGTTNSASAKTDTSGNASVDLVVTMQPGDNFMVAASDDLTYLNALTVNQILLQDSGGNIVGSGTPKAKASPMLTVWRRVHVEVDSMDVVPTTAPMNNHVSGHITEVNGTTTIATSVLIDLDLDDGSPKLDNPPAIAGNGRYENGTILIGTAGNVTATADLKGNGDDYVEKDTNNGILIPCTVTKTGETNVTGNVISLVNNVVKIGITGGTLTATYAGGVITIAGVSMNITAVNEGDSSVTIDALGDIPFTLVDDDDFNGNDVNGLHGDEGEDVGALSQTFSRMQKSDDPAANVYAPAYIRPEYDGGGRSENNNSNINFVLNCVDNTTLTLNQINLGRNSGLSESDDFWVAYIQVAYQPEAVSDSDPDSEPATGGYTPPYVNGYTDSVTSSAEVPRGADGSLIFIETMRDRVRFPPMSILDTIAAPHELGHQFGLKGDQAGYGIMFNSSETPILVDQHLNVLRWRVKSPGQP